MGILQLLSLLTVGTCLIFISYSCIESSSLCSSSCPMLGLRLFLFTVGSSVSILVCFCADKVRVCVVFWAVWDVLLLVFCNYNGSSWNLVESVE